MSSFPGYFIRRLDRDDPCSPLQFWPAKDSDELYEALKAAFPNAKTHKERMRDAVIEFHMNERNQERASSAASVSTPASATPSQAPSFSLQESFASSASPEYLPSPESINSSSFATPQPSTEASRTPSMQQMTSVWCLPNKPQAKTRTRRTMTEDEKVMYAQKRITGACADCRRRRRKCNHEAGPANDRISSGCKKARSSPKKKAAVSTRPASKVTPATVVATTAPSTMMSVDGAPIGVAAAASPPFSQSFDFGADFDLFPTEDVFDANEFDGMNMLPDAFDFFPQQQPYSDPAMQVADWTNQQCWKPGYSPQLLGNSSQEQQQYVNLADIQRPRVPEHSIGLHSNLPTTQQQTQPFALDQPLYSQVTDRAAGVTDIHSGISQGSSLLSSPDICGGLQLLPGNTTTAKPRSHQTNTAQTHQAQQLLAYQDHSTSDSTVLEVRQDLPSPTTTSAKLTVTAQSSSGNPHSCESYLGVGNGISRPSPDRNLLAQSNTQEQGFGYSMSAPYLSGKSAKGDGCLDSQEYVPAKPPTYSKQDSTLAVETVVDSGSVLYAPDQSVPRRSERIKNAASHKVNSTVTTSIHLAQSESSASSSPYSSSSVNSLTMLPDERTNSPADAGTSPQSPETKSGCYHGRSASNLRAEREHSSLLATQFYSTPESVGTPSANSRIALSGSTNSSSPGQSSQGSSQMSESRKQAVALPQNSSFARFSANSELLTTFQESQWTKFLCSQYMSDANAAAFGLDFPLEDVAAASLEDPLARIELRILETFKRGRRNRLRRQSPSLEVGACIGIVSQDHFVERDALFLRNGKGQLSANAVDLLSADNLMMDLQPNFDRQCQEDSLPDNTKIDVKSCWTYITSNLPIFVLVGLLTMLRLFSQSEIPVQYFFRCFVALLSIVPSGMALQKATQDSRGRIS